MTSYKTKNIIHKLASYTVIVILAIFMIYLVPVSFTETVTVTIDNPVRELAEIFPDNLLVNICTFVFSIIILYYAYRNFDRISLRVLEIFLFTFTFLLGALFIVSVKLYAPGYTDSFHVIYAALEAAKNNYDAIDDYFIRFPFQLGYVLYEEIFFRICYAVFPNFPEGYYCLSLQGVNLLWIILAYYGLIRIAGEIYSNINVQKILALILLFCFPAVISITFLYGNIPAFCCGILAVWMFTAFLNSKYALHGVLCGIFLGISVALKLNLLIFFAAIAIVWVLELINEFEMKSLLCLLLTVVCVFSISKLPQTIYEKRLDRDFGKGIPMITWMAMGFSEGHAGPGWYNGENTAIFFTDNGNDSEKTAENAIKVIHERAEFFEENPEKTWMFFTVKFKTQWNDPNCGTVWINQVQGSYGEKQWLYNVFCTDDSQVIKFIMNCYQQLIFACVLLAVLLDMKSSNIRLCIPYIVILGGMFYHLIFEAKSQYSLPYFMIMTMCAAHGITLLFENIFSYLPRIKRKVS